MSPLKAISYNSWAGEALVVLADKRQMCDGRERHDRHVLLHEVGLVKLKRRWPFEKVKQKWHLISGAKSAFSAWRTAWRG